MTATSTRRKIARAFDRSAKGYSKHARFQQLVASQTALRAKPYATPGVRALDIGCGDGAMLADLMTKSTMSNSVAVDVSHGMCVRATERLAPYGGYVARADAVALPIVDNSIDLAVSSLSLQWVADTRVAITEVARVVKKGGVFVAATLGPGTFPELRQSVSRALDGKRQARATAESFPSKARLVEDLTQAGFTATVEKTIQVHHYHDFYDFIFSIKRVGAMGPAALDGAGLARRGFLKKVELEYDTNFCDEEGLQASYEVLFIEATLEG